MAKNMLKSLMIGGLVSLLAGCTTMPLPEAIKAGKTVRDKMHYTSDMEQYGVKDYRASADEIKASGYRDDCDGTATIVASEMVNWGYPPLVLEVYRDIKPLDNLIYQNTSSFGTINIPRYPKDKKRIGHQIFVYQYGGSWGDIGISAAQDRAPKYADLPSLIKSLKSPYGATGWETKGYNLVNLDLKYSRELWVHGRGNLLDKKDKKEEIAASPKQK